MEPNLNRLSNGDQQVQLGLRAMDGSAPQILGPLDHRVLRAAVGPREGQVAVPGRSGETFVIRLWNLETGAVSDIDLGVGGLSIWDWVADVDFTPDGRVMVAFKEQLFLLDSTSGSRTVLAEGVGRFVHARGGEVVLSRPFFDYQRGLATIHDLVAGTATPLEAHGRGVASIAIDPSGAVAVTGSHDGIIRVGPASGGRPHWLVGHLGTVSSVAESPDGRLIASGGEDGTIRLWPMPDLSKTPLHDLPRDELLARLKTFTNLRVLPDLEHPDDYVIKAEPFPGWKTVPEW